MPQPSTSMKPVRLHMAQPAPPHLWQVANTSADGSVYGKKLGRKTALVFGPNSSRRNATIGALEVAHRDAFADDEALDLLEHRRVRHVEVVAAVDAAGGDDADRRAVPFHVADLHRRRVRAQQRRGGSAAGVRSPRARDAARRTAARDRACPACRARGARPACSALRSSASRRRTRGRRRSRSPSARTISSMRSRITVSGCRWPRGDRARRERDVQPVGDRPRGGQRRLLLVERAFHELLERVDVLAEFALLIGRQPCRVGRTGR